MDFYDLGINLKLLLCSKCWIENWGGIFLFEASNLSSNFSNIFFSNFWFEFRFFDDSNVKSTLKLTKYQKISKIVRVISEKNEIELLFIQNR